MREINVANAPPLKFVHAIVLGAPKCGKTSFAATAPSPLFISDAAEGGYATIQTMDPALWWNPAQPPTVWAIEDAFKDIPPILAKLETLKAEGKFPWRTIVIDPLSIYADRVLAELQVKAAMDPSTKKDNRQLYGDLANHLRVILLRFHALPAHVLWLCHVKDGGIALSGQTADKLPAYMDFTWLCNKTVGVGGSASFEFHTQAFGAFSTLGGRWSTVNSTGQRFGLPSPMVPSFKCVSRILKLEGEPPTSQSVPGFPNGVNYSWPPEPTIESGSSNGNSSST